MSLKAELQRLTLPIFMEIALVMLVGAVDTFMLSRWGDGAVAAVGMDNQLIGLIFLVYQFVSVGMSILCAQYFGAKERTRLVQIVGIALALNLLLGGGVSALLYLKAAAVLRFMGLEGDVLADGITYLKITGALSFFQALGFTFSASLRAVGKVKGPMYVTIFANIVNAVGNYALIFGHFGFPALGVAGAAYATAFSRIVSMILMAAIHFKTHIGRFPLKYFRPFPWKELKNLVHIGIPAMSEELSYCLSQVAITYFINRISVDALSARTYAMNVIMFVFLFCASVTQGGSIMIGHLVGRHKYAPAYVMGNYSLRLSMLTTLTCSVILALIGPIVFGFLTSNPEIIRMGTIILWIDVILEVGRVRNIFACGTLRAAGDVIYPVVVGVTFQWIVAVGVAYLLGIPFGLGLIGMWIGFALDENLRGIVLMRRWHSKNWMGKSFA